MKSKVYNDEKAAKLKEYFEEHPVRSTLRAMLEPGSCLRDLSAILEVGKENGNLKSYRDYLKISSVVLMLEATKIAGTPAVAYVLYQYFNT